MNFMNIRNGLKSNACLYMYLNEVFSVITDFYILLSNCLFSLKDQVYFNKMVYVSFDYDYFHYLRHSIYLNTQYIQNFIFTMLRCYHLIIMSYSSYLLYSLFFIYKCTDAVYLFHAALHIIVWYKMIKLEVCLIEREPLQYYLIIYFI